MDSTYIDLTCVCIVLIRVSTMMKHNLKIWSVIFQISILYGVGCAAQEETNCTCGQSGIGDCGSRALRDVQSAVMLEMLKFSLFPYNQQFCYRYTLVGNDCETAMPRINDGFLEPPSLLLEESDLFSLSDEVQSFTVATPDFSTRDCYPSQVYCIANINCATANKIFMVIKDDSRGFLTTNIPEASSQCTDFLRYDDINGDPIGQPFCGEDTGPEIRTSFEVDLHFASSQCCQACGSSLWMSCLPMDRVALEGGTPPLRSQQQQYNLLFIEVFNKQMLFRVRKTIIVPEGSVVSFRNSQVVINKTTTTRQDWTFSGIHQLLVFDEETVCYYSFWREAGKTFNSGILYVGYRRAWFIATTRELPIERRTEEEAAFIRRAVAFLKPFYTEDPVVIELTGDQAAQYSLGTPGMREYTPNCTRYNKPSEDCEPRRCPTPSEISGARADAKDILRTSDEFLATYFANLIIDTLTDGTMTGFPGHKKYGFPGKYGSKVPGAPGAPGPTPRPKRLKCPVDGVVNDPVNGPP